MKRVTKRLLIITGAIAGVLVCLLALGVGLYLYITQPLQDGARLGAVNAVVTGHVGPIAIPAYLFELRDGTVGLVDAGQDGEARAIRTCASPKTVGSTVGSRTQSSNVGSGLIFVLNLGLFDFSF